MQVIQDGVVNKAGDVVSKRVGFDVNPNSAHVQDLSPHLNLQTQINNKPVKKGYLADPHTPIDVNTIRPRDY